jgi:hypothetical protein
MLPLKSEFLFHLALIVNPDPHPIGAVPQGTRRIIDRPVGSSGFGGPGAGGLSSLPGGPTG